MFPETQRVIYGTNPLDYVVCQLRFPTVLRIDAAPPAAFQESIRNDYPRFQEKSNPGLPAGVPQHILNLLGAEFAFGAAKTYEFGSNDNLWTVVLTRDSLAVTTKAYERWEGFKSRFNLAFRALCEEYHPLNFSRIGLRYADVIRRDKLGLANVPWSELLIPQIAAEFGSRETSVNILQAHHQVVLRDPDRKMQIFLQHGLYQPKPESQNDYFIDIDIFVENQTETTDALATLDAFNSEARRLFRWCITEQLHSALKPERA